jgi:hypothetical protein
MILIKVYGLGRDALKGGQAAIIIIKNINKNI